MSNKYREYADIFIGVVTLIVIFFVLLSLVIRFSPSKPNAPWGDDVTGSTSNPVVSSSLSIAPKKSVADSDLLIKHTYRATIDNEVVDIPVHTVSSPSSSSLSNPSTGDSTVSFKQELDLTPLV